MSSSPDPPPFQKMVLGLGLFVSMACLAAVFASPARAEEERPFPTLAALGASWPLDSSQGRISTLVYLDHESRGEARTWKVTLETVVLTAGLTEHLAEALHLAVRGQAVVSYEGDGESIFLGGARDTGRSFVGDGAALALGVTFWPKAGWGLDVEGERRRRRFNPTRFTEPGNVLPPDSTEDVARAELVRRGLGGLDKARVRLKVGAGRRVGWRAWSLDPEGARRGRYTRRELTLLLPVDWSEAAAGEVKLFAGNGANLDWFSGFWLGSALGALPVAGYYRNEFRAREAVLLNLRQDYAFAEDRVLSLYADAAWLRDLELPYFADEPGSRQVGGVALGFRYGIRALGGMPVIVRYAEGLGVPDDSLEAHRREFVLIVAAGF